MVDGVSGGEVEFADLEAAGAESEGAREGGSGGSGV